MASLISKVDSVGGPSSNAERSREFYVETLGLWGSGKCRGACVTDPAGNRILLHRRYAPYADGTMP